jgi:hypothetical protein
MSEQRHCRSCNEPIVWGETAAGRRAPFNLSDGQNHFITCPQRREWRKTEPDPSPTQTSFLPAEEPPADPTSRRHWETRSTTRRFWPEEERRG